MPRVLITNEVPIEHLEPLDGVAGIIMGPSGGDTMPRDEVLRLAPELDAIINQAELIVDAELLDGGPNLKIIANVAIGTNNLDTELMAERGVWATNTPEAFVDSTADCTLGMLLALVRRLHEADAYVRKGKWEGFQPGVWDGMELRGKTWGIIGYGKIGRAVEQRAKAFGVKVLPHSRTTDITLEDVLRESDIISLHVPLTDGTQRLLDAERLSQIKPGAVIVNMARGPVIDESALVDVLKSGHLAGAALDVFEHEPEVHPDLLTMHNVLLTPHIGGGTRESRRRARRQCAENIALVLTGQAPVTPVNNPRDLRSSS